ncbi:helix-turn-helix domain-containing protein [Devosia lacusdianchii]|uniref:helix-turn-helix domain-containing protein n=1 Tax=Devosia lacusdianchii TaxID=2917991 RepID=UPI001F05F3F6|nr:helix-turn-helix domain-containing protein [Devosia sp. JXJ CY 41]
MPGILYPEDAARSYAVRRFEPTARLAPFVEYYWMVDWHLPEGQSYATELLPQPRLNLAFTLERGWVTGVTTSRYTYTVSGSASVVGIMFRPGGFRPFLGHAVAELVDRTIEAETLFPRADAAWRQALLATNDPTAMLDMVEALLAGDGLPEIDGNVATASRIVSQIQQDRSIVSVGALAERSGLSERTLQHLFQNHVGVRAKWVIRLYRLTEAARLATEETDPNWTRIAHELGYTDQAHFSNDFRNVVGRSPVDYMRNARQSPDAGSPA